MHSCPYRLHNDIMQCQHHINNGVDRVSIDEGICEKCLFYQNRKVDVEKASLNMLVYYTEQKLLNISFLPREEAIKLFNTIYNISTKIYKKDKCIEFLSDALVKISKNQWILEEDIEQLYGLVSKFEEN